VSFDFFAGKKRQTNSKGKSPDRNLPQTDIDGAGWRKSSNLGGGSVRHEGEWCVLIVGEKKESSVSIWQSLLYGGTGRGGGGERKGGRCKE